MNEIENTLAVEPPEATPGALWAVHLVGPDDVQAAPSHTKAAILAAAMRAYLATRKPRSGEPEADARVILWPGNTDSHAADLADWPNVCRDWEIQP